MLFNGSSLTCESEKRPGFYSYSLVLVVRLIVFIYHKAGSGVWQDPLRNWSFHLRQWRDPSESRWIQSVPAEYGRPQVGWLKGTRIFIEDFIQRIDQRGQWRDFLFKNTPIRQQDTIMPGKNASRCASSASLGASCGFFFISFGHQVSSRLFLYIFYNEGSSQYRVGGS